MLVGYKITIISKIEIILLAFFKNPFLINVEVFFIICSDCVLVSYNKEPRIYQLYLIETQLKLF